MSVATGLIEVRRSFDPRDLDALELWLPHFLLPGSPSASLGLTDHWLGAPPLGARPGSLADGNWFGNDPAGKAYLLDDSSIPGGGDPWAFPWIAGQRGLYVEDVPLRLVDIGTTNPRTITLTGELTLVMAVRNSTGSGTARVMDDGTAGGNTGLLQVITDRVQAKTSTTGGLEIDITPDNFDMDGSDNGEVVLVMLTRSASNLWRCWINGTQQAGTVDQDGTITLKSVYATPTGQSLELADVLLYSADHSDWAGALGNYFAAQHGVSA